MTRNLALTTTMRRAALGAIGAAALVVTVACNGATSGVGAAGTETGLVPVAQTQNANGQILVNCEPHQRALVRQMLVNGQAVAQVECVAVEAPAYSAAAYPTASYAAPARDYGYDARVVQPTVYREPAPAPRRVSTQPRVVTERASGRTWKKSAIIIGSSAGIGAGVGAAMGGKKGALIGAAIGGGGAAIWDQVTRKK
jgi:hypothetical protein